jgi:acetylornithine deacetylase
MNDLEQLLHDLVAIDSINPDLVPGAAGEAAIAAFIAGWLRAAGLEVHLAEVRPGRPNVVGIAHGAGGGRSLLLNGHIDTVGVAGMSQPFRPRVEGGKLYGRGAYDMKGGMAACLIAAAEAARLNLRGDVIVTAVMDEEYAGLGTLAVAEQVHADGAIVAEPTELQLVVAHKGFVWLEVETQGVAAHGSRPHLGVDAIAKMGGVLTGLERLAAELAQRPPHPLLGPPSVHASTIQGGGEWSTYPDRCTLAIERRTLPGETGDTAEAELRASWSSRRASRSGPTPPRSTPPAFRRCCSGRWGRGRTRPRSGSIWPACSVAPTCIWPRRRPSAHERRGRAAPALAGALAGRDGRDG